MMIRDVMRTHVFSTEPDTNVREAAQIMADNRIGCLLIKQFGRLVGIVTDHDVLVAVAENGNGNLDVLPVRDIMSRRTLTIHPDFPIEKAAMLMLKHKIKKLPVLEDDRIIGIITSSDIVSAEPLLIKTLKSLMTKSQSGRKKKA